jgi:hypothetical protein
MPWHQVRHDGCEDICLKAFDGFGVAARSYLAKKNDAGESWLETPDDDGTNFCATRLDH